MKRFFAARALLVTLGWSSVSAQQINTIPEGTTGLVGSNLGVSTALLGGAKTYQGVGQVFTAPGSVLLDFSFFLETYPASVWSKNVFSYRAFVGGWDVSSVTSVLWESTGQPSSTQTSYQQTTFAPGLAVTSGFEYLAYLFPSVAATGTDLDLVGYRSVDGGSGGMVTLSRSNDPGQPTGFVRNSYRDAAFIADFSTPTVVPEPSTWALLATGLLGIGGVALRRRKNPSA